MKQLKIFDENGKALHIDDVIRSVYFDIPDSEMTYATYSTKAYFDEQGWFLIDCDGKKQYEEEKWLKVSSHNDVVSPDKLEQAYKDGVRDALAKGYGTFDEENYR